MKRIKLLSVFLFLLAAAFISCNSDDDTSQAPALPSVTATVNGAPMAFNTITTDVTGPLLSVNAVSADLQHSVNMVMDKDIAPGTYPVFTDAMDGTFMRYMHQSSYFESETGTLIVTSNNGQWIEGTFHFDGVTAEGEAGQLTEGEFRVKY